MLLSVAFAQSSSYDIEKVYSAQKTKSETLGLTKMGTTVEVEKILVPMKIKPGIYSVQIKRVDTNLYEIIGKDIFIKTRFCYKYAFREKVIMEIKSNYGYSIGKLHF